MDNWRVSSVGSGLDLDWPPMDLSGARNRKITCFPGPRNLTLRRLGYIRLPQRMWSMLVVLVNLSGITVGPLTCSSANARPATPLA